MSQDRGRANPRRELVDALLDKVARTRFPSTTQLDLAEQAAGGDARAEFAAILIEKIRAERYPSPTMVRRVLRLTAS